MIKSTAAVAAAVAAVAAAVAVAAVVDAWMTPADGNEKGLAATLAVADDYKAEHILEAELHKSAGPAHELAFEFVLGVAPASVL